MNINSNQQYRLKLFAFGILQRGIEHQCRTLLALKAGNFFCSISMLIIQYLVLSLNDYQTSLSFYILNLLIFCRLSFICQLTFQVICKSVYLFPKNSNVVFSCFQYLYFHQVNCSYCFLCALITMQHAKETFSCRVIHSFIFSTFKPSEPYTLLFIDYYTR